MRHSGWGAFHSWLSLLHEAVRVPSATHATLLLKEGINVKVVSERLGHANIGITLDSYAHVLPSMQQQAADGIDAALFGVA